ncbi:uncharacterized protein TM35_000451480, partial [Trypanosoma theileri]
MLVFRLFCFTVLLLGVPCVCKATEENQVVERSPLTPPHPVLSLPAPQPPVPSAPVPEPHAAAGGNLTNGGVNVQEHSTRGETEHRDSEEVHLEVEPLKDEERREGSGASLTSNLKAEKEAALQGVKGERGQESPAPAAPPLGKPAVQRPNAVEEQDREQGHDSEEKDLLPGDNSKPQQGEKLQDAPNKEPQVPRDPQSSSQPNVNHEVPQASQPQLQGPMPTVTQESQEKEHNAESHSGSSGNTSTNDIPATESSSSASTAAPATSSQEDTGDNSVTPSEEESTTNSNTTTTTT